MYGKSFASMYTGSMFGQPALVFAVWGYVLSNMRPDRRTGECYVELNPIMLAPMFSESVESIMKALDMLEAVDEASRTAAEDGRRLILQSDTRVRGPNQYLVVNGAKYRELRDEEERRAYMREAKRRSRAKSRKSTKSTDVRDSQPPSTQVEVEVDAEVETGGGSGDPKPPAHVAPAVPNPPPTPGSLRARGMQLWAAWERACGGPMGSPGPQLLERLGGDCWRTCDARKRDGETVPLAFERGAAAFRADAEVRRKKLDRKVQTYAGQLAEWLDPSGPGNGQQQADMSDEDWAALGERHSTEARS